MRIFRRTFVDSVLPPQEVWKKLPPSWITKASVNSSMPLTPVLMFILFSIRSTHCNRLRSPAQNGGPLSLNLDCSGGIV